MARAPQVEAPAAPGSAPEVGHRALGSDESRWKRAKGARAKAPKASRGAPQAARALARAARS